MDANRKNIGEQAKDKFTPDTQKTYTQQAGDKLSGAADRVKAAVTPDTEKSAPQRAADRARGATDEHKGIVDSVKDTFGMNNK